MKTVLGYLLGLLVGFFSSFVLFGLHVLPETTWTWSYPWEKPIEMQGQIIAPMLVRIPNGDIFIVYKYESHNDYWQLLDYTVYTNGVWGKPHNTYSFPLPITNNTEVLMLPYPYYEVYPLNDGGK